MNEKFDMNTFVMQEMKTSLPLSVDDIRKALTRKTVFRLKEIGNIALYKYKIRQKIATQNKEN